MTSKEQQTKEEDASKDIQELLGATRPKNVAQGLASGVGYILQGAVGAVGIAILMPGVTAKEASKDGGGVLGGVVGGVIGAVGGVLHGANVMGGGLVTGVSQMARGVVATPESMMAPRQGKWWNEKEGKWVLTNLLEEERWMKEQPAFDQDILGDDVIPDDERPLPVKGEAQSKHQVKDMYYYDLLNLSPSVDSAMIKRRYYIIARKYSPDRCGANAKAQEQFEEIGRAYCVLMNDDLRARYDKVGREGLFDFDEQDESPDVDPQLLYTFLFGSEKMNPYFGPLAAATAVRVGDDQSKITWDQARLLQKRRVTRLSLQLADRLQAWAQDDMHNLAKADWMTEAEDLSNASYGIELVHVIGKVYALAACQFLGSIESGIGMPSISKWAKKQSETMKVDTQRLSTRAKNVAGNMDRMSLNHHVGSVIDKTEGDEELEQVGKQILKNALQNKVVRILWQQTVVDITNTIHEAAQMVLHDQNVSAEIRKKRGQGLQTLGEIFQTAKKRDIPIIAQEEMEEIAFNAMLDTVWRQESAVRAMSDVSHS